jgi:MOSC domain-containing protein YiiM
MGVIPETWGSIGRIATMKGHVEMVWTKAPRDGEVSMRRDSIQLVANKGVVNDRHFDDPSRPNRQVLLVGVDLLEELGLGEGVLREQITVDFPGLQDLKPGSVLKVGAASIEITGDCAPCLTMAKYLEEDGQAFVNRAMRKRGMLGKVVEGGTVMPGDAVILHGQPST